MFVNYFNPTVCSSCNYPGNVEYFGLQQRLETQNGNVVHIQTPVFEKVDKVKNSNECIYLENHN